MAAPPYTTNGELRVAAPVRAGNAELLPAHIVVPIPEAGAASARATPGDSLRLGGLGYLRDNGGAGGNCRSDAKCGDTPLELHDVPSVVVRGVAHEY